MCILSVPAFSPQRALEVLANLHPDARLHAARVAMEWLVERHPGPESYQGITGREYNYEERQVIGMEVALVSDLGCPFLSETGCMLGNPCEKGRGCGQDWSWLPTLVARFTDPVTLRTLAKSRQIADAKLARLLRDQAFPRKTPDGTVVAV